MTNEITDALSSVSTSLSQSINIGTIGIVVAAVLGGCVGLYLGWFAIRKLISSVQSALRGRLRV